MESIENELPERSWHYGASFAGRHFAVKGHPRQEFHTFDYDVRGVLAADVGCNYRAIILGLCQGFMVDGSESYCRGVDGVE